MIVIGLGNPGKKYQGTRHNLGSMVVEALVEQQGAGRWKKEFGVRWTRVDDAVIAEPQEYMNVSGASMKKFLTAKGLPLAPDSILVIHDDLDLALGDLRIEFGRGSAGHQGVASLIEALGTPKFYRLRIGLGSNRASGIPAEAYVLQKFSLAEQGIINQSIAKAAELAVSWLHRLQEKGPPGSDPRKGAAKR